MVHASENMVEKIFTLYHTHMIKLLAVAIVFFVAVVVLLLFFKCQSGENLKKAGTATGDVLQKRYSLKFRIIHRTTPVLESLFQ